MNARLGFACMVLFPLIACDGSRPSGPPPVDMQPAAPSVVNANRDASPASPLTSHGLRAGSIVFYSARSGVNKIYAMTPGPTSDATVERLTSSTSGAELWPDVSPDGRYVAYTSNSSGHNEIYVLDLRNHTQLNVSNISGTTDSNWPRWSPNGHRIAFHSNRDGNYNIFTVKADGTDLRRVTSDAALDQFPDWSPNGRHLAFRRGMDIYVADADGEEQNVRQLTFSPTVLDQMAVWSPSGRRIAFMSVRDGYPSVFVMRAAGETPEHPAVNLTPKDDDGSPNSAWTSRAPFWSKNGRQIYFSSFRPSTSGDFELFVMKADGRKVSRLTTSAGEDGGPRSR